MHDDRATTVLKLALVLDISLLALTGDALLRLTPKNALTDLELLSVRLDRGSNLALNAVQTCRRIVNLRVAGDLSDEGLPYLARLERLEIVDFNFTNLTGAGMRHLRHRLRAYGLGAGLGFSRLT